MIKKKILVGISAAVLLSGCSTIAEFTGNDSATLNLNAAEDYKALIADAKTQKALDTSSSTYKRVNAVYQRMLPFADEANKTGQKFDWQLAVIKSNEVNAFVVPGGKVVVFTGIVNNLKLTDAEIAAVMGHEITHALEEHAKSKIGAQALTKLAVDAGKTYAGDKLGSMGSQAVDFGSKYGVGLPYSRSLESRADRGGLMLMAKAGYDPEAAVSVWKKMNQLDSSSNNGVARFTSTHPSNNARIEDLNKSMAEAKVLYASSNKATVTGTKTKTVKKAKKSK
ncbi:M48 family metallopeptidase [Acinetobacter chinensis]|uniref:M48 family metallopeptidase n=1 Tax=Acinetobacter chinensis TaxID=2004650 RepID=A0ABU3WEL0_9GAMM|nr:M48 family metallopeptidase [Acinetobacter chinensis]MDV2468808.1 M48 family metallopeptidase [Acinetobacter chinensis]